MKYILDQEEFDNLMEAQTAPTLKYTKALQKFCTDAANSIILKSGWREGHVWGCILSEPQNDKAGGPEWYCDECPAQEFCPAKGKRWSK
jgi:hypothetical protein